MDVKKRSTIIASLLCIALLVATATVGAATINGTAGNDTLRGGAKADKLSGKGGNDKLFGAAGTYQHCVRAVDRAANSSAQSCAPIIIK